MTTGVAVNLPATAVPASRVARLGVTAAVLVLACAAVLLVALGNAWYFETLNAIVRARGEVPRAVVFSSWLLVLGLPIVARRPGEFGFRVGGLSRHVVAIVATVVVAVAATTVLLRLAGPTPYRDASPFVEIVLVPVTEELVFRAVLLSALVAVLRRLHPVGMALALAVAFDGIAFGLGHLTNAAALEPSFVVAQAAFATGLGMGCAGLMVRTRSVYPAILLHGAVNAVVVAA